MLLLNDLGALNPWRELDRVNKEFDRLFKGVSTQAHRAPLNIYSDGNAARVTLALPGWAPEWMDITAEGNKLNIKGNRPKNESGGSQSFERSVTLPFHFDGNSVRVAAKAGVLTIELERHESEKPRKIAVESA